MGDWRFLRKKLATKLGRQGGRFLKKLYVHLVSYETGQHGLFPLDPFRKRRFESDVSAVIRLVSIGNTNRRTTARSQTPFRPLPWLRVKHFPHHGLVCISAANR